MPETTFEPLFRFEDLCKPVQPLPWQAPVFERSHREALHKLKVLQASVTWMLKVLEDLPRQDGMFDHAADLSAKAWNEAGLSYAHFLATRDCQGET